MAALSAADFTTLLAGLDHPEDLVWDDRSMVLYAGSQTGDIYRGSMAGDVSILVNVGSGSFLLGLALDDAGRIFACDPGQRRVIAVDPATLAIDQVSIGSPDRVMIKPNYPAFCSSGRLFVSDSGDWGQRNGVIYSIDANGDGATSVWDTRPCDFTNGIALSPDERYLYVAESHASRVSRISIEADGAPGSCEQVWHVAETVPDGLAFDADGRLYISCYTPDSVYCIDHDGTSALFAHDWSGQTLQAPTNIAFVGDGLSELATANLCGWHLNVTGKVPSPGHPLNRPATRRPT